MELRIAHPSYMCSTLILAGTSYHWRDLDEFVNGLEQAIKLGENKDICVCHQCDREEQTLHGHDFDDYAYVVFTHYDGYEKAEGFFKEVGFVCALKPTYNEKNETTVNLWTIRVPDLLKYLREYKRSQKGTKKDTKG